MGRSQRIHDALWVGALVFLVVYALPLLAPIPQLFYLPLERRWALSVAPGVLKMDWYGRTLTAAIAALVAGTVALQLGRDRHARPSKAPAIILALVLGGALALYVQHIATRTL